MKRACITGITGQDGSYLADLLLEKGYEVHGLVRRSALEDPAHRFSRLARILDKLHLHAASLESFPSIYTSIGQIQPDELYHLAAQSFVSYSFEDAFSTFLSNIHGTHYVLESVRQCVPKCRVYFAGSSEMFGKVAETPQSETTVFHPRSPYGISKVTGFDLARNYREAYDLFVCSGILFNHESPRRGYRIRHAEDHLVRRQDQGGAGQRASVGQPGSSPRLGVCQGLRAGDAPDAAAGSARRFRRRHGRNAFRPRVLRTRLRPGGTRLSQVRYGPRRVFSSFGSELVAGKRRQGGKGSGMAAYGRFQ